MKKNNLFSKSFCRTFSKSNNYKSINSKKAQIEVTFHWVFVLIAGAAILAFFLMITKHEKDSATDQTARSISGRLEALLSAIEQNPDSVQIQDKLNVEMEFSCNEEGHTYKLKGSSSTSPLQTQILFSPKVLGNAKTIAWTRLYTSPYPVAPILYFSDENTEYIFVDGPAGIAKKYYDKFPEQFERKFMTEDEINQLEDQGFRQNIIVTEPATNLNLQSSLARKSTILVINDNAATNQNSYVEFIYHNSPPVTVPYINEETLFGAIVSGDDQLYGCAMEKLMRVSRIVGNINLNRTAMIGQTDNAKCNLFFVQIPQQYIEDIITESTYSADKDYSNLRSRITTVQNLNKEMSRANCPTIY
jgi:hypothetical protein